ncbi:unnamed protein product [Closterium sp. NIES-54]
MTETEEAAPVTPLVGSDSGPTTPRTSTPTAAKSAPAGGASPSPSKPSSSTPQTKRPRGSPHPRRAATSLNIGPGGSLRSGRTTARARAAAAMEDDQDDDEEWGAMSKSGRKGRVGGGRVSEYDTDMAAVAFHAPVEDSPFRLEPTVDLLNDHACSRLLLVPHRLCIW